MKKFPVPFFFLAAVLSLSWGNLSAGSLAQLLEERLKTVVAVEYIIEREIDRETRETVGLVLDDNGLIILGDNAIPGWVPVNDFRDFKVFIPGKDHNGYSAEYLGQDYLTGWAFLRVEEAAREELVSIQQFPVASLELGEPVWGIAILPKEYNFAAGLLKGYLGLSRDMPNPMHFTDDDITTPGAPVFDLEGNFVGWGSRAIPEDKIMYMGRKSYSIGLVSPRGSSVFHDAASFLERAFRVPEKITNNPRPWIGIAGMQPMDEKVAEFMGLENQGAVQISDVIEGGPAAAAGLLGSDIVVGVDGRELKQFSPENIVISHFEQLLRTKSPGDTVTLTLARDGGSTREDIAIQVGTAPTNLRDAAREYFDNLGFSVREFTLYDGIGRRVLSLDYSGVIAQFVRPNSSTASAGLQPGDWIQKIDGRDVVTYEQAVEMIKAISEDSAREDFVLQINRNNETQLLRVKIG